MESLRVNDRTDLMSQISNDIHIKSSLGAYGRNRVIP